MKKAFAFNKEKFNSEELEEKSEQELFDLWYDNFADVTFYDNETGWQDAMNNGEFEDKIVIFIEADDLL